MASSRRRLNGGWLTISCALMRDCLFITSSPIFQFLQIPGYSILGSGIGSFVAACRQQGLKAFGVEPDRIGQGAKVTSIQIARRRVTASVFASGVGEALPFADGVFRSRCHEPGDRTRRRPIPGDARSRSSGADVEARCTSRARTTCDSTNRTTRSSGCRCCRSFLAASICVCADAVRLCSTN